jgi:hypothetical protein
MSQSTGPGNPTSYTTPDFFQLPVANGQNIYQYRPVAVNTVTGLAYPMTASANLRLVGIAQQSQVGNTAQTNQVPYTPPQGPDNRYWTYAYTGTLPQPGNEVYFVDDQTVALSAANSVPAGVVIAIVGGNVIIDMLPAVVVL